MHDDDTHANMHTDTQDDDLFYHTTPHNHQTHRQTETQTHATSAEN